MVSGVFEIPQKSGGGRILGMIDLVFIFIIFYPSFVSVVFPRPYVICLQDASHLNLSE